MISRRYVLVKLAEDIAELRQRVAYPQAPSRRGQVVGIAQPHSVDPGHGVGVRPG